MGFSQLEEVGSGPPASQGWLHRIWSLLVGQEPDPPPVSWPFDDDGNSDRPHLSDPMGPLSRSELLMISMLAMGM